MSSGLSPRLVDMDAVDGPATFVVIVDGDVDLARCPIDGTRPDLALVDALARLQLAVRRLGWSLEVRSPSPELRGLLELVGLAEVLGLPLQAGREPEGGEQLGVEEVVEPGDPVA